MPREFECRPKNASLITKQSKFNWTDETWMQHRKDVKWLHAPNVDL